ncbi:MAG: HIRAN domain-containing protein [Betaproteobacteria bacterium]|nr:HIRAN domain-containing protein [Betaproteobacteria bacterium]
MHAILATLRLAAVVLAAAALPATAQATGARIIVQQSPLAGFQYYEGKGLWEMMRVGDTLTLVREPQNRHDANAVRVEWRGEMLGYVPRRENSDVARQMDHGAAVKARIVRLTEARNPWQRIRFEVYVDLKPVAAAAR